MTPSPTTKTTTLKIDPAAAAAQHAAYLGTLQAIAAVLSARFLLLLACIGAFVLAMSAKDWLGVLVLVAFCVLTVLPLAYIDYVSRQRTNPVG